MPLKQTIFFLPVIFYGLSLTGCSHATIPSTAPNSYSTRTTPANTSNDQLSIATAETLHSTLYDIIKSDQGKTTTEEKSKTESTTQKTPTTKSTTK
jgi:hypothetical protein